MIRALLTSLLAAVSLAACANPCITLAEKVCECEPLSSQVEDCKQAVNEEQVRTETTSEDEDRCEALLDSCTCEGLTTPEGKQACGLAR